MPLKLDAVEELVSQVAFVDGSDVTGAALRFSTASSAGSTTTDSAAKQRNQERSSHGLPSTWFPGRPPDGCTTEERRTRRVAC